MAFWAVWIRMYDPDNKVDPPQPKEIGSNFRIPPHDEDNPLSNNQLCVLRYLSHFQWLRVLRSLINNVIILTVQPVAGYASFVASSHCLDY